MRRLATLALCGAMLAPVATPAFSQQRHDGFYDGAHRSYSRNGYNDQYDRRYYQQRKDNGIGPGKGALIGGAGGAALGALFGGGMKGALIGGAAGAGVGALAGKAAQNKRRNDRNRDYRDYRYNRR
ncbi:hypothetical protein [Terriglobus tenax]|uniref:hypothetical protein n=1 Tax=Terriglobus tenax TaxID=1111115 RepID=UPI0021E05896|nr:hypothetical protein [Terriglobus tenax]